MTAIEELSTMVGTLAACRALAVSRASVYRRRHMESSPATSSTASRPTPARALTTEQRSEVLEVLHSERFVNTAPAEVHATLLDEGTYLASVSTMYRILAANEEVRERRNQLRHPVYKKPEQNASLVAGIAIDGLDPFHPPGTGVGVAEAERRSVGSELDVLRHRAIECHEHFVPTAHGLVTAPGRLHRLASCHVQRSFVERLVVQEKHF